MRKALEETLKEIKQDARGALKLLYKYPNWGVLSGYDAAKTEARMPLPDGYFLDQAKGLSVLGGVVEGMGYGAFIGRASGNPTIMLASIFGGMPLMFLLRYIQTVYGINKYKAENKS